MNILLLDNSHLPLIGGKEIVVHHLAKQFQNLGHQVRVAGPAGVRSHRKCNLPYPVDRYVSFPLISNERQWAVRARLILARKNYDIVHAHTTHPCGYHAQQVLSQRDSAPPLIVTPHGADIHKVPEIGFGKRLDPVLEDKIGWLLENCAGATAISKAVHDSLNDAGMCDTKIIDIPNGVDIKRMSKKNTLDARQELGLPNNSPLVVTVGNYHKRKGHEVLAKAISLCSTKNVHLVVIGRKSKVLSDYLDENNLQERITFTGMLPFPIGDNQGKPDLLVALLQQASCYVSSSIAEGTEGLSLALLEAMAASAPIIATDISGNQDVIEHECTGLLVPPNNSTQLANAIDRICEQPNLGTAMSEQGSQLIADYSWEQTAKQYLSYYQRTIDTHSEKK